METSIDDETVAEIRSETIRTEIKELQKKGVSPELKAVLSRKLEIRPKMYLSAIPPQEAAMTLHPAILSFRTSGEKQELQKKLNMKISSRPTASRLYQTNILKYTPDGPVESPEEFEKAKREEMNDITVNLVGKIVKRPSKKELWEKNIIKSQVDIDPKLAEKRERLKKSKLRDSLNQQLSQDFGKKLKLVDWDALQRME